MIKLCKLYLKNKLFVLSEKCELLSVPTGGNVTISTDGSVTKASISCMAGYTMSGISTLTCGSDGTWDIQTPSCGGNDGHFSIKNLLFLYHLYDWFEKWYTQIVYRI
jgi:hypothetical protein